MRQVTGPDGGAGMTGRSHQGLEHKDRKEKRGLGVFTSETEGRPA